MGEHIELTVLPERSLPCAYTRRVACVISLVSDPVPFRPASRRWLFRCPLCGTRRRFLYARVVGEALWCRGCYDLVHQSAVTWDNWARTGAPGGVLGRMVVEVSRGGDGSRVLQRQVRRAAGRYASAVPNTPRSGWLESV